MRIELIRATQNRAYAASQLSDLAQKLAKAQTNVPNTKAPPPAQKEDKAAKVSIGAVK